MLNVCQCAMVVSCLTFALFLAQKSCCQFKISIFQLRALSFGTHNANSNQENTCRTEKHEHYIILFSTIKLDNFHENCWHKFSGVRGAPGDILLTFLKKLFLFVAKSFWNWCTNTSKYYQICTVQNERPWFFGKNPFCPPTQNLDTLLHKFEVV